MKLVAVLAIAGALALGRGVWEAPIPGRFEASLRGDSRASALTVVLHDQTGLVRAMTDGGRSTADRADGDRASTLITLDFASGVCDDFADLTFSSTESRFRLTVSVVSTPLHGGEWCSFLTLYGRSVMLELSHAVAPGPIEIEQRQRG